MARVARARLVDGRESGVEMFKLVRIQFFTTYTIFADMDNTKTHAFHNRFDEFEVRGLIICIGDTGRNLGAIF